MYFNEKLNKYDQYLIDFLKEKIKSQENKINLLNSNNYLSLRTIELQVCNIINKYRYNIYYINKIEKLAIKRACNLFSCDYANIISSSYNDANELLYKALTNVGDIIICISINKYNDNEYNSNYDFLGRKYIYIKYILDDEINYKKILKIINILKPKLIKIKINDYLINIDWSSFRTISNSINSYLIIDISNITGLIVINDYPNPINYAHLVISETNNNLRGPIGGLILSKNNPYICKKLDSFLIINNKKNYSYNMIAAKAMCFKEALDKNFKNYQMQIIKNVKTMINIFINRSYEVILNSEKNSYFFISLIKYGITGKYIKKQLKKNNILVDNLPKVFFFNNLQNNNNNNIYGIKICAEAITTRGFKEKECKNIAIWICDILDNIKKNIDKKKLCDIKNKINKICKKIPIFKLNNYKGQK